MLYNNWLASVAERFQRAFDEIAIVHNFEFGDEFEMALAKTLQKLLPRRFGVCRGYLLGADGTRAGDDIIIFDAHRFPTVRALAQDLAQLEQVPAEAVLAYIEAKHTLYVAEDEGHGQSLAKATRQVERVKAVKRAAVGENNLFEGVTLSGFTISRPKGAPDFRNPYYAAVWARHVKAPVADTFDAFAKCVGLVGDLRHEVPDAIIAGECVALPGYPGEGNTITPCRFVGDVAGLVSIKGLPSPLGIGFAHLLWAIEWIRLGELPWSRMIVEQFSSHDIRATDPPTSGMKFYPSAEVPTEETTASDGKE